MTRLIEVREQVLVEALVAQPSVEALHKAVLHRFTRRDVVPFDVVFLLPGQDSVRCELAAVVADDHAGAVTELDDVIELPHDLPGGERGVSHQTETLPGEVIDHCENAESPSAHQGVSARAQPKGSLMFDRNARYVLLIVRVDLPEF